MTSGVPEVTTNARFVAKLCQRPKKKTTRQTPTRLSSANIASSVTCQRSSVTMKTTANSGRNPVSSAASSSQSRSFWTTLKSVALALKSVLPVNALFNSRTWRNIKFPVDNASSSKLRTKETKSWRKLRQWKSCASSRKKRKLKGSLHKRREKNRQERRQSDSSKSSCSRPNPCPAECLNHQLNQVRWCSLKNKHSR